MTPADSAASRLCTACGLCCNGVLFPLVKLRPGDSIKALEALGLSINRKKRDPYFKQPCAQLENCTCRVYEERPRRCRLFECRQLRHLAAGETSENEVLEKIRAVKLQVRVVEELLESAGDTATHLPLAERCQAHFAETAADLRILNSQLDRHFRPLPPSEPGLSLEGSDR